MSIIDTLVTNRTQADVDRLKSLYAEGFDYWTADDLYFFLHGEPEALEATDGTLIDSIDDDIIVGDGIIRGAYNEWDLNRVGRAMRYLADKYEKTTLSHIDVMARMDWHVTSIPTTTDMTNLINDIKKIRSTIGAYSDTPAAPSSVSKLNYKTANNIEKILIDANRLLDNQIESWRYAGEVYAGEV